MEDTRCAVVGSGLAALAAFATLRHGGLEPEQIRVVGTDEDPTTVWRGRAAAIRQRRMRSESEGHLGATSFPGLSVQETMRTVGLDIEAGSPEAMRLVMADPVRSGIDLMDRIGFRPQ